MEERVWQLQQQLASAGAINITGLVLRDACIVRTTRYPACSGRALHAELRAELEKRCSDAAERQLRCEDSCNIQTLCMLATMPGVSSPERCLGPISHLLPACCCITIQGRSFAGSPRPLLSAASPLTAYLTMRTLEDSPTAYTQATATALASHQSPPSHTGPRTR